MAQQNQECEINPKGRADSVKIKKISQEIEVDMSIYLKCKINKTYKAKAFSFTSLSFQ